MTTKKSWHALESDPDIWRLYVDKLGVDVDSMDFIEIYSLDEDLSFESKIFAFIFLYPDDGSTPQTSSPSPSPSPSEHLWTIKQIEQLDSCCCLIALLHSIGNNLDKIRLKIDSPLEEFYEKSKTMNADERAECLLNNERIHRAHEQTAQQGQTKMLESERVGHHYVAFILSNEKKIYEMNGSSRGPQAKFIGETTKEKFSSTIKKEIQNRVEKLNGDIRFSLIGISSKSI